MPIIILAGQFDKTNYIHELAEVIPNSIYLNINPIQHIFSQPKTSAFTEKFSFEQRISKPSHAALANLAHDNVNLGKIVILDGNIDYQLLARYLKISDVKAISFYSKEQLTLIDTHLIKLTQNHALPIDITQDIQINRFAIFEFLDITPNFEEKPQPLLTMVGGLAGSGKTTHLHSTCPQIKTSVYLDKDTVALPFLDEVSAGMPSDYYNIHVKSQSYETVFELARNQLTLGKIPVLDGCFGDRLTSPLISNHLATSPYRTTIIYFQCTGPTQLTRIIKRNYQRDTEKLKDIESDRTNNIRKHLNDFSQIHPDASVLYVDTERDDDLTKNVAAIMSYIISANLISLKIIGRVIPYSPECSQITTAEAQGGLAEFLVLLERTRENDQRLQRAARVEGLGAHREILWNQSQSDEEKLVFKEEKRREISFR